MAVLTVRDETGARTFACRAGDRLSDALRDAGVDLPMPCAGRGACGKCRVRARGALSDRCARELALLTEAERAQDVRLACQTHILGDCAVELLGAQEGAILAGGLLDARARDPRFSRLGAAVDIGTTTLAAALYDQSGFLCDAARRNPQSAYGADVISRVGAALEGRGGALAAAVRGAVADMLAEMTQKAGLSARGIDAVVVTGNTAMLYLFAERNPRALSRAPFIADTLFDETLPCDAVGLPCAPGARVYLPRCMAAFVGADITCAALSSGVMDRPGTALLADIGTNGELVLSRDGVLYACSTAAGPAFEGADIQMGMPGVTGAIDAVSLKDGFIACRVVGGAAARGVCGSGIVDAVAVMLRAGALDETGRIEKKGLFSERVVERNGAPAFMLRDGVVLTQRDIRQVQLAKSAICAGIWTLCDAAGVAPEDVASLDVAGGFGHFLNMKSAAEIGLVPPALAEKARAIGNAALAGASMLLLDNSLQNEMRRIAGAAREVDLTTSAQFNAHYMDGMLFE